MIVNLHIGWYNIKAKKSHEYWRRINMSTLEKTINLLNALPENQIEMIYSFVQFLDSQQVAK